MLSEVGWQTLPCAHLQSLGQHCSSLLLAGVPGHSSYYTWAKTAQKRNCDSAVNNLIILAHLKKMMGVRGYCFPGGPWETLILPSASRPLLTFAMEVLVGSQWSSRAGGPNCKRNGSAWITQCSASLPLIVQRKGNAMLTSCLEE